MGKQAATAQTRRASEWRERLTRYSTSGQTVRAFCAGESVSTAAFHYWRARLAKRGVARPAATFIDVGAMRGADDSETASADAEGRFDIRLELGGGVVLHVARR